MEIILNEKLLYDIIEISFNDGVNSKIENSDDREKKLKLEYEKIHTVLKNTRSSEGNHVYKKKM